MAVHETILSFYAGLDPTLQMLVKAFAFVVVAYIVVGIAKRLLFRAMARTPSIDRTLAAFFRGVLGGIGWIIIVLAFLTGLGVDPVALVGTLAIGGFILAFALKDTLGNLAAGVMLLVYRPFNVGEGVKVKGHEGTVVDLGIALTRLKTWDGLLVSIPNGAILGDSILNYTRNGIRRIEVNVGVDYGDNIDSAVQAALSAASDSRVLTDPAPQVVLTGLGESSVDLQLRAWANVTDFGATKSDLIKQVKLKVEASGCSIPFPQRDLHMIPAAGAGNGG